MDVCKVSDTSKVRISRTDHRPPERAREASERGGSLKSFLPDRPSNFAPKRLGELQPIMPAICAPDKLRGSSPSASRTASVPPDAPIP